MSSQQDIKINLALALIENQSSRIRKRSMYPFPINWQFIDSVCLLIPTFIGTTITKDLVHSITLKLAVYIKQFITISLYQ